MFNNIEDIVGAIIKEYLELKTSLVERELKPKEVVGKALSIVGVRREKRPHSYTTSKNSNLQLTRKLSSLILVIPNVSAVKMCTFRN